MNQPTQPVRLPWTISERHRHICAFVRSPDEEYALMLPFIQEGVDLGHRIWYFVDPELRDQHLRVLAQAGLDTDALHDNGQLEVRPWEEVQFRPGYFDQDAMLSLVDGFLASNEQQGLPMTRIWADMAWALKDLPGVSDISEFESRWNDMSSKHQLLAVCAYNVTRFPGGIIMDMLRTHPFALVGGMLYENPFYSPPEEFQRELRHRGAGAAAQ
jgi:hypothetical protein